MDSGVAVSCVCGAALRAEEGTAIGETLRFLWVFSGEEFWGLGNVVAFVLFFLGECVPTSPQSLAFVVIRVVGKRAWKFFRNNFVAEFCFLTGGIFVLDGMDPPTFVKAIVDMLAIVRSAFSC